MPVEPHASPGPGSWKRYGTSSGSRTPQGCRTTRLQASVAEPPPCAVTRTAPGSAVRASNRFGGWPADQFLRLPDLTAIASFNRGGAPTDPFTLHLDHYAWVKRQRRINPAGLVSEVEEDSRAALSGTFRMASAPSDAEIVDDLETEIELASPPRSVFRVLDDWLAAEGARTAGEAATSKAP